jgi:hypothetical protein
MTSSFFIFNQKKSARSSVKVNVLFYAQSNQSIRAITAKPCQKPVEVKAEPDWLAAGMEIDLQRPDGAHAG